jgi:hypothetical protein
MAGQRSNRKGEKRAGRHGLVVDLVKKMICTMIFSSIDLKKWALFVMRLVVEPRAKSVY